MGKGKDQTPPGSAWCWERVCHCHYELGRDCLREQLFINLASTVTDPISDLRDQIKFLIAIGLISDWLWPLYGFIPFL